MLSKVLWNIHCVDNMQTWFKQYMCICTHMGVHRNSWVYIRRQPCMLFHKSHSTFFFFGQGLSLTTCWLGWLISKSGGSTSLPPQLSLRWQVHIIIPGLNFIHTSSYLPPPSIFLPIPTLPPNSFCLIKKLCVWGGGGRELSLWRKTD